MEKQFTTNKIISIHNILNTKTLGNELLMNLGVVGGIIPITILCDLSSVSATERTLWPAATLAVGEQEQYVRKDTAGVTTIVSNSVEDTNTTGTGIWTVKVSGLNGDYEYTQEVVALNGTNPVTLTNQFLAVNEINPELVGSSYTSQGDITVLVGGDILAIIEQGVTVPINITRQGIFTVPIGTTFLLTNLQGSCGKDDDITMHVYSVNPVNGIYVRQQSLRLYQGQVSNLNREWIRFPEKHLLEARAFSESLPATPKSMNLVMSGTLVINEIVDQIPGYFL